MSSRSIAGGPVLRGWLSRRSGRVSFGSLKRRDRFMIGDRLVRVLYVHTSLDGKASVDVIHETGVSLIQGDADIKVDLV